MSECKNCEVELDKEMTHCPLCGLKVGESSGVINPADTSQIDFRDKIVNEIESLSPMQKKRLIWEICGFILGTGILVTLIINLITQHNIVWAKYNLLASIITYINITLLIFLRNKPVLLLLGSMISIIFLFVLIDFISSDTTWGVNLGVPISLSFYLLSLIVAFLIRISKQIGFNILAIVFIAIGIFMICIETSISLYTHHQIHLKWSIITTTSVFAISIFLFFVHYRLKKGVELKRFFHI